MHIKNIQCAFIIFAILFDDTGDAGIHTLLLNRFVSYSSEYQYYLLHCLHFPLIDHQVSEPHQPFRIHTIHKGNCQRISDCLSKLCQCHALPYSLAIWWPYWIQSSAFLWWLLIMTCHMPNLVQIKRKT